MKKILISLAAMLMFSAASYAQLPLQLGVQGGLNLSNLGGKSVEAKAKIGFQLGVTADYALGEALSLQSGLSYTVKGATPDVSGAKSLNLSYLELPINVAYKVANLDFAAISLKAGPYLAYGLSAKMGDFDGYKEYSEEIAGIIITRKAAYKRFDYGVGIGAAAEFGQIVVGLNYQLGLANIDNHDGNSLKNRNAFVNVGYKF